jgi:hypothetical protein
MSNEEGNVGLTNDQWKRLYNQAVEKQKKAVREIYALENAVKDAMEELNQAAFCALTLRNHCQPWTEEQVKNCGEVILNHTEKAMAVIRAARVERPVINTDVEV